MKAKGGNPLISWTGAVSSRADLSTPGKEPPVPIGYVAGYVL